MDLNSQLNPWLQNSGEYQAGKTFEYVMKKYGLRRDQIIRLAGNESTIGTSPLAITAAKEAAAHSNYYDEPYSETLIAALENKFAERGLDMSKLGVVVGNGMDSVIDHILMLFCSEQSSIVNYSPTFVYYDFAAARYGIEIINVSREQSVDQLAQAAKDNTKIVFLCTPNNPTGSAIEVNEIEALAQDLLSRNIILFIDHAYIEFADPRFDATKLVEKYPNIIIGYTFSKAYAMAGFRVGYGLMSRELQLKYLKFSTPFLCSKPSLAAAKTALEDLKHLEGILDNNLKGKKFLVEQLSKLGYTPHESQANFLLFETPKPANEVLEQLMSQGVIIRAIPNVSEQALRVTIGTKPENHAFIEALANV